MLPAVGLFWSSIGQTIYHPSSGGIKRQSLQHCAWMDSISRVFFPDCLFCFDLIFQLSEDVHSLLVFHFVVFLFVQSKDPYSINSIIFCTVMQRFVDPAACNSSVCSSADKQSCPWPIFFKSKFNCSTSISFLCVSLFVPAYGNKTSFLNRVGISREKLENS